MNNCLISSKPRVCSREWLPLYLLHFLTSCTRIIFIIHAIYQTRETVFHRDIQTPRRELKIRHAAEYFWRNSRCLESRWNTVLSVWYILSIETKSKEKKWQKSMLIKISHAHVFALLRSVWLGFRTLFFAINQFIPTLRRRSRPPWTSNEIMNLIRKKKKLWDRMKVSGSPDLFLKFKEMRKITKKHIHLSYIQYLKNLSVKLKTDPKLFWSFHSMKSKRKRIPEIIYYNETHSNPATNVELFNQFFRTIQSLAPQLPKKHFPLMVLIRTCFWA